MSLFDAKKLMDDILLQQAVYCKQRNIAMPDLLKKRLDTATTEEEAEAEIRLIEAEYLVDKICNDKNLGK